jgi:hypothetical protein
MYRKTDPRDVEKEREQEADHYRNEPCPLPLRREFAFVQLSVEFSLLTANAYHVYQVRYRQEQQRSKQDHPQPEYHDRAHALIVPKRFGMQSPIAALHGIKKGEGYPSP